MITLTETEHEHPPIIRKFMDILAREEATKEDELAHLRAFREYVNAYRAPDREPQNQGDRRGPEDQTTQFSITGTVGPVCALQANAKSDCRVEGCPGDRCLLSNCPLSVLEMLAVNGKNQRERVYNIRSVYCSGHRLTKLMATYTA